MSSYSASAAPTSRPAQYAAPMSVSVNAPTAPAGTFAPGTKIQVGTHKVVIQKYFSEGGFAHVYLVKMPAPIDGTDIAVLKRVACPDKESLANMRTEVETMKKLKGHRPIVTYYDSHASQMNGGGYEVFLLMEFCNGGGLIDFMNTRLQNRLTEPEILKIFSDVAEGVACMHYLKPPLLHRDLKVENVLITLKGDKKRFKLCDFGSTAPPRPAGTTAGECRLIEEDIQKHTTMQYRSPEMVDVYRKQAVDEKADIWALGVLLYKLCYYTTPFEEQGQLAILNASFKYPSYPSFSTKLKLLIASMLKEHPMSRPSIYQVLREACVMQGIEVPIKDIYQSRTTSESRRNQQLPTPASRVSSPPVTGAQIVQPVQQKQVIPDVVPMRRGRVAGSHAEAPKPSTSPVRATKNDPFTALDSKSPTATESDEIADRFPSLDQFSLLHEHGRFDFNSSSAAVKPNPKPKDLTQRVTERLADDAFSRPLANAAATPATTATSSKPFQAQIISKAQRLISSTPSLQHASSAPAEVAAPIHDLKPSKPVMVSQGTMTSPSTSNDDLRARKLYEPSPIYRFPPADGHNRAGSLPRTMTPTTPNFPHQEEKSSSRNVGGAKPSVLPKPMFAKQSSSSSRPSLEGGRPTAETIDPGPRPRSSNGKQRPTSTYLESSIDYLREREAAVSTTRPGFLSRKSSSKSSVGEIPIVTSESNIASNVEFLRRMEAEEAERKKDRRRSSGEHHRRQPSGVTGAKSLLAGRFGDAFKKFEINTNGGPRTPSPLHDMERKDLTPIAGSEATDGRSDDGCNEGHIFQDADVEDMPPEQRREFERRRLSLEEKRVADAAAEYRKRLAEREAGTGAPRVGQGRASAIQDRVKNFLEESQKVSPIKTAEGYGRFTQSVTAPTASSSPFPRPKVARKPIVPSVPLASTSQPINEINYGKPRATGQFSAPARSASMAVRPNANRPFAPAKPAHLGSINNTGSTDSPPGSREGLSKRLEANPDMTLQEKEDYIADFSKRFPSVGGLHDEFNQVHDQRHERTREV